MSETILVSMRTLETRVAVLEQGTVQDIHVERGSDRGIVGNVYSGRVVRVLPGMQAAFVEYGAERAGLVRLADLAGQPEPKRARGERRSEGIENRLHDGQKLQVQVVRDPVGKKGARLTTELSLSTRFLVFLPRSTRLAVSQRIDDSGERARLLLLLQEALAAEDLGGSGGYILRTSSEGVSLDELRADLRFLKRLWDAVQRRAREATSPCLLYEDLPLHLRVARDLAGTALARIVVDNETAYLDLRQFCDAYVPEMSDLLEHYCGPELLFDRYGAERAIEDALNRRVELASGGYLLIEQGEAMTTIDVNTGSFVGRRNALETIFRTNMEAAAVLARQLRLRNIGGIVVVDFIDMTAPEHWRELQQALQLALAGDDQRTRLIGIPEMGLMAMTRKRNGESLQHELCEECPACRGAGKLKSARTVCHEIFREIWRMAARHPGSELLVVAAQMVVNLLQGEEAADLAVVEAATGTAVRLRPEPRYGREHFDIAML